MQVFFRVFQCQSTDLGRKERLLAENSVILRSKKCFIALPPYSEQKAIVEYLDTKCVAIDAKIGNIAKRIEAYKRLKRALTNEVVTGKRAV